MLRVYLLFAGVSLFLSSCAFNKIFLHPYVLETSDHFTTYVEELEDSITMTFTEEREPIVVDSKGEFPNLSYSMENVFFPNSIGDTLNAWLFSPRENYNGSTIYFLHSNAGHLVYQFTFVTPFVNAGYQVFIQDYSGFGFSSGKATRKNIYRDGQDGLDYLIGRKDIEYEKLLIYGQSLGGHLAAVIATDNQGKIDALIIEGAFSSHKDMAASRVPLLGRLLTQEIYSAEKSLPEFRKPLLVIHSSIDKVVSYKQGKRLYEIANQPKELFTIEHRHIRGPIFYADSIVAKMNRMVGN